MKTVMLCILDGFGINDKVEGNAIKLTNTPNFDKLISECPHSIMHTSGFDVGLPDGQMGNSEVGHMNIGAGRIVFQEPAKISKLIRDEDFFSIPELLGAINNCKKNNTNLHIMGLLSDGGVHSLREHLYALLDLCNKENFKDVYIHPFMDGRDTPPNSGEKYIIELETTLKEKQVGKIASVIGRYYAMDRDNRWERIEKAYNVLVNGEGEVAYNALQAVLNSYASDKTDEFILPTVILEDDKPVATIKEKDSVIYFNFRHDRGREITRALVDPNFKGFERELIPINYVCMTEYDSTMPNVHVAIKPEIVNNTFAEYISNQGMTQLRIAETEKYAHVTFFFNGGSIEEPFNGEDRILIPSPKVDTYDMQPEMSIKEVTERLIEAINSRKYNNIVLNFANPDMVGHTGKLDAAIKAVKSVDYHLGLVVEAIKRNGDIMLITADHGNIEQMIDYETGLPHTAHTTNSVPIILVGKDNAKLKDGKLADIAPTMLYLMGLEIPKEMTGKILIKE